MTTAPAYKRGLIGDAQEAVGGMSNTSKMPGLSTGLVASGCNVGGKLRNIVGSVCNGCYAFKGMYVLPGVKAAHARREAALYREDWVPMMATAIGSQRFFRWHDSGDIRSLSHLIRIVAVAMLRPDVRFWIPTREYALVAEFKKRGGTFPKNLVVRQSAPMIGAALPNRVGTSSMVLAHGATAPAGTYLCPASQQEGKCLQCRACWSNNNKRTAYPIH